MENNMQSVSPFSQELADIANSIDGQLLNQYAQCVSGSGVWSKETWDDKAESWSNWEKSDEKWED